MASLSSSTNTRLPPSWPSENNPTTIREASFSSYLNSSEENYIRSLVESSQTLVPPKHDHPQNPREKKVEDGEIDVFSADKYFNSGITETRNNNSSIRSRSTKYQTMEINDEDLTDVQQVGIVSSSVHTKPRSIQSRTPSSNQSEYSSNSQSALLKRFNRTPSRISTNNESKNNNNNSKLQGAGMISLLSCSCCVKKSVDIDREFKDHVSKVGFSEVPLGSRYSKVIPRSIKTSLDTAEITRLNKLRVLDNTDPFIFPVSDSPTLMEVEDTRKSLDVFGSSDFDEGSKRFSLQKRLNMLAWDSIPRTEDSNTSGAPSETYKDTESDASSDLFEIECLSCTANPIMQSPRILHSDGSVTPTTRYAPSEASIEWSVVTASAADFSFGSDSEDQRTNGLHLTRHRMGSKPGSYMNKEVQKPVASKLLGCKSQKAVNVAREVHRRTPPRGKSETHRTHRLSDSFGPVTRFQAEAKMGGFGHRQRQNLGPDLLYIQ
ncbi:unnamed protein product [Amaranthus hypochondriacus]